VLQTVGLGPDLYCWLVSIFSFFC